MAQDPRLQLGGGVPFPEVEGQAPQQPEPQPEQVLQAITAKMLETLASEDLAKDVQAQTVSTLAQAFKTMVETMTNDPQQQFQMEQEKMQMQMQMEQQKMQMEMEKHQAELQMKQQEHQMNIQFKQQEGEAKLQLQREQAQFKQAESIQNLQHKQVEGEQKLKMNEEAFKQKKAQQNSTESSQAKPKTKP